MSASVSEHPPKSRQLSRFVLVAVLVVIGGWLAYKWWWAQSHVTTDNAQIDASIVPIQPKVSGIVVSIPVKNNQVVPGNVMKVTLACDHRTVDGATGAAFLQTLRTYLENPVTILA